MQISTPEHRAVTVRIIMNMQHCFTNTFAGLAVAGVLFASISTGHADDQTNMATRPATNGISISITAGHQNVDGQNYYGLPKEAFDRLTPEQIMELAQAHQKTFVTEQLPDTILTILVPVALFTFIGVCVALGVNGRLKRNRMLHDTIRLMIEKGQPIPPELLQPTEPQRRTNSDLRRGLIWTGIGVGLAVSLLVKHDDNVPWPLALIPLLIGIAFLITWKIESNKNGQSK
jgi:hypothetical protein